MSMTPLLLTYIKAFIAFVVFAVFHSYGAHESFKDKLAKITGRIFVDHFWRIAYCAISYWLLFYLYRPLHWFSPEILIEGNTLLFTYPLFIDGAVQFIHLLSIVVAFWAFLQSDYLQFLGFKQAWNGIKRLLGREYEPPYKQLFGTTRLEVRGIYCIVRHPMLASSVWFAATMDPTLNNLIFLLELSVYVLIGVVFEERRLRRVFGEDYLEYSKRVGAFIPNLRGAII